MIYRAVLVHLIKMFSTFSEKKPHVHYTTTQGLTRSGFESDRSCLQPGQHRLWSIYNVASVLCKVYTCLSNVLNNDRISFRFDKSDCVRNYLFASCHPNILNVLSETPVSACLLSQTH